MSKTELGFFFFSSVTCFVRKKLKPYLESESLRFRMIKVRIWFYISQVGDKYIFLFIVKAYCKKSFRLTCLNLTQWYWVRWWCVVIACKSHWNFKKNINFIAEEHGGIGNSQGVGTTRWYIKKKFSVQNSWTVDCVLKLFTYHLWKIIIILW